MKQSSKALGSYLKMQYWVIVLICAISSLCLSCKKCETRYEPDFTEDELSWVKFEDKEPTYLLKYWDRIEDKLLYVKSESKLSPIPANMYVNLAGMDYNVSSI
jgi:hypothetical protein